MAEHSGLNQYRNVYKEAQKDRISRVKTDFKLKLKEEYHPIIPDPNSAKIVTEPEPKRTLPKKPHIPVES